jgi:hypothetical protein
MAPAGWEAVIGLEVHVQLATRSKIFSGASTEFGAAPNAQACVVDLGLPGVLPVLNAEAVRMAVMFGQGLPDQPVRLAHRRPRLADHPPARRRAENRGNHPRTPRGGRRQIGA